MRLRRYDTGQVYLDRWGFEWKSLGGIFLHRMAAPDPGVDLHDHPWWFASVILWGGYTEERAESRTAPAFAKVAEHFPGTSTRGEVVKREWLTVRTMRLDECHRVTELMWRTSWSLVIHGPNRRNWGFYTPEGWIFWRGYEQSVRGRSRNMHVDISSNDPVGSRP
jgi:hypothetical protein